MKDICYTTNYSSALTTTVSLHT